MKKVINTVRKFSLLEMGLSVLALFICAYFAQYGLSVANSETTGWLPSSSLLEGLSIITISIGAYYLWLEVGLEWTLKKVNAH